VLYALSENDLKRLLPSARSRTAASTLMAFGAG